MFKLFKGEVMKILRMPTIYILTIVLSLVITFSFLLFNPTSSVCQTYPEEVDFTQKTEVLYKQYYDNTTDKFSKTQTNNLLVANSNENSVEDLLNYYNSKIVKYDENGTITQKSAKQITIEKFDEVSNLYLKLLGDYALVSPFSVIDTTGLDATSNIIYLKLKELQEQIENDCNKRVKIAPTCSYLLEKDYFNNLIKSIEDYMKELADRVPITDVSETESSKNSYELLTANIKQYFNNYKTNNPGQNDNIFKLADSFKKETYDLGLTSKFLDEIEKTYLNDAKEKLEKNQQELEEYYSSLDNEKDNTFEKKEELLNKISLQYSTGFCANLLTQSIIVQELSKDFSDVQFNEFVGISELMKNYEKVYKMDRFNQYNFKQQISRYQFIYDNNLIEHSHGMALSSATTSNFADSDGENAINAFDYSFYVLDIFGFVIIIFAVILASNMIAGEQKDKTMKLLAIRPYSRRQILSSKIFATLFFAFIFVVMSVAISLIAGYFMYGINFNDLIVTINGTTTILINPFLLYLIYVACLFVKILFYVLFAFLISTMLRSYMGAAIVNIFCILIATVGNYLLGAVFIWKYLPFSNLDMFKYFGNGTFSAGSSSIFTSSYIIPGTNLFFSLIVAFAFIILFSIITHAIFKKRDIA